MKGTHYITHCRFGGIIISVDKISLEDMNQHLEVSIEFTSTISQLAHIR
jgi:hypothetical protein